MGYAIYVGRVGALAVALGVGAAVVTGYAIGGTAVAWADDGPRPQRRQTPPMRRPIIRSIHLGLRLKSMRPNRIRAERRERTA